MRSHFFVFSIILSLSPQCFSASILPKSCHRNQFDETVHISHVIDGDTVVLKDKRHIRLIGLNAPERSHNNNPADFGAELARKRLMELLKDQSGIKLGYDEERVDRYGRTLAHLYLENGFNVQALMLLEGLAVPLIVPPNLLNIDCYTLTSQMARKDRRGLWALSRYVTRPVSSLTGNENGFYVIVGAVTQVSETLTTLWINLENNVALRIVKGDLKYFNRDMLKSLVGTSIEVNGWLYQRKSLLRMRIRHPLAINNIINTYRN